MDRGAWRAAVMGPQSWTWLSNSMHAPEEGQGAAQSPYPLGPLLHPTQETAGGTRQPVFVGMVLGGSRHAGWGLGAPPDCGTVPGGRGVGAAQVCTSRQADGGAACLCWDARRCVQGPRRRRLQPRAVPAGPHAKWRSQHEGPPRWPVNLLTVNLTVKLTVNLWGQQQLGWGVSGVVLMGREFFGCRMRQ